MEHSTKIRRRLTGKVESCKMQKTIVVRVDRTIVHPKYGKRYMTSKRYKVHDPNGQGKEGQMVTIEECRPLSKDKRWRIVEQGTGNREQETGNR